MNKQIEEMAKIIDYQPIIPICLERDKCEKCSYSKYNDRCKRIRIAEALYNEGYKQEKEVAQKIFHELKEWCHYVYHDGQEGEMVFFSHVIDIVKKFGVEVK